MMILNLVALIAGIVVLIVLSYRGLQMYITALLATLCVIILTPEINFFDGLTTFAYGTGGFVSDYLIYMFLAVALGDVMNATGTATTIGRAILKASGGKGAVPTAVIISAAITTTGISGYVAAFASFPIVLQIFKGAKIPRELLPGILASSQILGQGILPFNTLTNNTIPSEILGSSIAGAPLIRVIGFLFCYILICGYFSFASKNIKKTLSDDEIMEQFKMYDDEVVEDTPPSLLRALVPIACGMAFLVYMTLASTWRTMNVVYVTLTISMVLCIVMNYGRIKGRILKVEEKAFVSSVTSTMVCGIVIGFGDVMALSPFFEEITNWLSTIHLNPYWQTAIICSIFAMIMASAPGGIRMTLNVFGASWLAMGVNANALHAITTTAGLGLNTMPHNGSVIVCNERARLPIKGTFRHTFITGGIIIMLGSFVQAALACILYPV